MRSLLETVLACPKCRSPLTSEGDAYVCGSCAARFPVVSGIPRLNGDALNRDGRIAAEWQAQRHAHDMYLDQRSVLNRVEDMGRVRLLDSLRDVSGPVADVGCGIGGLGRVIADQRLPGMQLVGIDVQAELLEDARAGYAAVIEGDIHRMPLEDAVFAGAVVANALHHVADPLEALVEVRRILRPGGAVVAIDPRRLAPLEAVKRPLRRRHKAFTAEHRAFGIAEYRGLFDASGLVVDELVAVDPFGPLIATALDLLRVGRLAPQALARALVALDRALARLNRRSNFGLMLLVHAHRP